MIKRSVTLNALVRYYCAGQASGATRWTLAFLALATLMFWQALTLRVQWMVPIQILLGVFMCYMATHSTNEAVEWRAIRREW